MTYSRVKLDSFLDSDLDKAEYDSVAQDLLNKVFAKEKISLSEESFICSIIKMLRTEKNELAYNIDEIDACKNHTFKSRYMMYVNDLNGYNPIFDAYGEIPKGIKESDSHFLNESYIEWEKYIANETNGDELINHIAKETNEQLKELKKYCDKMMIGSNYRKYLKKSLTLHGKYIYLLVKEFYQEIGIDKQVIEINNKEILIDSYTYVHTLFRHYSRSVKLHQLEKSYHFDEHIGFKTIPNFLFDILNCYKSLEISNVFDAKNINIIFNDKPYAIYFKPVNKSLKGNVQKEYLRVQTFYPIEDKKELEKINSYEVYRSDCGFEYLIKTEHNSA